MSAASIYPPATIILATLRNRPARIHPGWDGPSYDFNRRLVAHHPMNFSAVILAGGQSSRMGRDKAWLELNGETLLARQIKLVRTVGAQEVFISGRPDQDYREFACPILLDKHTGSGPLAGIERALAMAVTPLVLVLAVDLPALNEQFILKLLAACANDGGVIPRLADQLEPLIACYPKAAQALAAQLLAQNQNAVTHFARECVTAGYARFFDFVPGEAKYFTNWNLPGEFSLSIRY